MKSYAVKITSYAQKQMAEIRDYIAFRLCSPDSAANLLREMYKATTSLSQMPERFGKIEEEPWRERGIRKLSVKNFFVYYWIDEESSVVYVTAVTYAMRDQINVLYNMDKSK